MALQSEVSPPIVGESNKDHTQIDGDTKSDVESSQSTDEDIDLEEGEILDSGAEEEEGKDFTKSSLQDSLDQSCLRYIAEQISQAKNAKVIESPGPSKPSPPQRIVKPYIDHDQREAASDNEDGWAPKSKTKYNEKTIDYRMELAAYRGTPPSSPDRKRRDDKPRRKSIKKVKKMKKLIRRKDAKGQRVLKYKKDAARGKICKFYKEGKCAKGADCPFSHPTPQKKKELCKFYLNGHCNKGNECHFMHNDFPCKFFHTGSECYAGKDCRFSHIPLTDEMQRVLADYLRMSHGDDIRLKERDDRGRNKERKRRFSHSPDSSPPEQKRVCLLGSPPRHIREAEETKRWQEEMKLQQQNHPGFEIHLENEEEIMFTKPNFYKDTLLNTPSPKKKHSKKDVRSYSHDSSNDEEEKLYVYDENNEIIEFDVPVTKVHEEYNSWEDKAPIVESAAVKIEEKSPPPQEPDFTNDIKFDETTQFSEMESFTDYPPALSPEQSSDTDEPFNLEACKLEEKPLPPPSIIIPSHLPRRQQQLFMRVLQQQRKNDEAPGSPSGGDAPEVPSSPPPKKEEVVEVKCEPAVQQENSWYSSEDDEEDSDEPLTDVLKKIQQAPPPKPQTKPKPKVNLLDMLNKIQQKSLDTNKSKGGVSKQQQGSFWKNLLGEDPKPKPLSIHTVPETNRRTLLPDPTVIKTEPPDPVLPKDPRLKNRDLRKETIVPPKPNVVENLTGQELGSDISKLTTVPPTELTTANIPYKLRGIVTKPLNYTPYISASQSNPNLLKDPRLRKHMNPPVNDVSARNGKDPEVEKPIVQKDVPPMPDLLLNYKPTTSINIFESSTSTKPVVEPSADVKPLSISDSSTSYLHSRRRESRCSSGSDTPPHLTIVDSGNSSPPQDSKTVPLLKNIWAPPVLEKSYSSPVMTKAEAPVVKEEPLSPPLLQINEPMSPPTLKIKEPSILPADGSTIKDNGEIKVIPTLQKIWTSTTKKEIETTAIKEECLSPESKEVVVHKKSTSPLKEQFVTMFKKEVPPMGSGDSHPVIPPLIIKKVKPTVASHLPRAIADPRMAKLHTPLDPRRPRVVATEKLSVKRISPPKDEPSEPIQNDTMSKEHIKKPKEEKTKATKNIPKKRRLSDKSEERKRTVHRNRKSSMDYASPLNSYVSNTNKELDYNSYNQRPKRSCNKSSQPSNSTPAKIPDVPVVSDFVLSDSSSLDCDNSSDINLKDKFKTIDPTASPFC